MSNEEKLSKIFHDLKGPLVAISGYMQILRDDLEELKVDIDYIPILLESCQEMEKSIQDARKKITEIVSG